MQISYLILRASYIFLYVHVTVSTNGKHESVFVYPDYKSESSFVFLRLRKYYNNCSKLIRLALLLDF